MPACEKLHLLGPASRSSTTERRMEISALNFDDTGLFLYIFLLLFLYYAGLFCIIAATSMPKYSELKLCSFTYR